MAVGLGWLFVDAASAATRGPCRPGGEGRGCLHWTGKVTLIADGDTLRIDIAGDGTSRPRQVRFVGINAMEQTRYSNAVRKRRGACHALEATAIVDRYVRRAKWRVELVAQRASSRTGHRIRRQVWVRSDGRWQDLSVLVLQQGLALWLPNDDEWAPNRELHELAEEARAAQQGLYDPDACRSGPDQDVPLTLWVNWDGNGNRELGDEWVQINNPSARPVSLAGWWFRDSWLNTDGAGVPGYAFPAGTTIPAAGSIRLNVGCGTNTATAFFWCQTSTAFENASHDRRDVGDGGYLFDRDGDLRASMIYPCALSCTDALQDRVQLRVRPQAPESISVSNVSAEPFSLEGYQLKLHHPENRGIFMLAYSFGREPVLQPGDTLDLLLEQRANDPLERAWPVGPFKLRDREGAASLRTFTDIVIACDAWGAGRC
jgi:micrococcal nuclease